MVPGLRKFRERYPQKDVWCYSGYTFHTDLQPGGRAHCEATDEMLSMLDILVDGEFVEDLKDLKLRFRGSANQRIIDVPRTLREGKVRLWKDGQY